MGRCEHCAQRAALVETVGMSIQAVGTSTELATTAPYLVPYTTSAGRGVAMVLAESPAQARAITQIDFRDAGISASVGDAECIAGGKPHVVIRTDFALAN